MLDILIKKQLGFGRSHCDGSYPQTLYNSRTDEADVLPNAQNCKDRSKSRLCIGDSRKDGRLCK